MWDADGTRYVDYLSSWGPAILGHADPATLDALRDALPRGTSYGAPTEREIAFAEAVGEIFPSIEQLRMTSSGSEAVTGASRLARAATGGTEVKGLGDGLMVVYTSVTRALAGAVAMQQARQHRNRRSTTPLTMRIGVSTGDVLTAEAWNKMVCAQDRGGGLILGELLGRGVLEGWEISIGSSTVGSGAGLVGACWCQTTAPQAISNLASGVNYVFARRLIVDSVETQMETLRDTRVESIGRSIDRVEAVVSTLALTPSVITATGELSAGFHEIDSELTEVQRTALELSLIHI